MPHKFFPLSSAIRMLRNGLGWEPLLATHDLSEGMSNWLPD